jgi:hypothetical protein
VQEKVGEVARAVRSIAFALVVAACGGGGTEPEPTHVLRATVGSHDDGSGLPGMAALTTIRTAAGEGPDAAWTIGLTRGGARLGADGGYGAGAAYAISAWPAVTPAAGLVYRVVASDGTAALAAEALLPDGAPLALPAPALAADGTRLEWPAVERAAAYACVGTSGASVDVQEISTTASCDVAARPAGPYRFQVDAFSADPRSIPAGASPELPARFDVSSARLGLFRRAVGESLVLRAAGGRIDYGLTPGLAIWVGLADASGAPDGGTWSIEVTGPNLPPSDPLAFTIPANFTRRMVWAYDLPPDPGLYTITARSGLEVVSTQFAVGAPEVLPLPDGLSVQTPGSGTVKVVWSAVPGARSYLAAAWLGSAFVAGQWVAGTEALFPAGTFTAGQLYDVTVTATSADMSGGEPPVRVSASENSYTPASFTAP